MAFSKGQYSSLVGLDKEDVVRIAEFESESADKWSDSIMQAAALSEAPVNWAFENFIVAGDQVMIAGAPKSGKSWLALQMSLAAASGGKFLQWKADRPMKTLYINLEVGRQMWAKRVMLQIGGAENALSYTNFFSRSDLRMLDVTDPDELKKMREYIKNEGYEFVVIDVLSRCHSVDENDNGSMRAVLFALRHMCGDATSVVVHHARKPPSGAEHVNLGPSSIRGASSILGEVDMALVLVVRGGQGARYSLSLTARNVEVPDELLLDRSSEDMLYYEHEGQESNLDEIIQTLFKGGHSLLRKDVQKAVADGMGVAFETARKAIRGAIERGLIAEARQGHKYFYYVPTESPILRAVSSSDSSPYLSAKYGEDDCPF